VTTDRGRNEFLGRGWKFPIKPNIRGGLEYVSAEQDIQEAIWIILSTALGERQMRPQFGCGIHEFVFAPNSAATRAGIAHQIHQALTRWEARIDVVDARVEPSPDEENVILIRLDYRIRANNSMHSLVYPFYIRERGGS
jgi:uncharacterized protein